MQPFPVIIEFKRVGQKVIPDVNKFINGLNDFLVAIIGFIQTFLIENTKSDFDSI